MPKFDLYTHDDDGPPPRRWTVSRIFAWTILGFSLAAWLTILLIQT